MASSANIGGSSVPAVATYKVFVVVDQISASRLGFNDTKILHYVKEFLNRVNNFFSPTRNPQIRFEYYSHKFHKNSSSQPYILKNELQNFVREDVLTDFGIWMQSQPYHGYNVALLLMGRMMSEISPRTPSAIGIAKKGAICDTHGLNVTVVFDEAPNYTGVSTAAHELAHLLGVRHDEETRCESALMGEKANSKEYFTDCSLQQMNAFVRSDKGKCYKPQ